MARNYQPATEVYSGEEAVISRSLHPIEGLFTKNNREISTAFISRGKVYQLNDMPDIEKTILLMRDGLGFGQRYIAEMLGLTTVTVGQYLDRARSRNDTSK